MRLICWTPASGAHRCLNKLATRRISICPSFANRHMLPIRRTCHFLLDAQKGWRALKIRYRIRYGGGGGYVTSIFVGHRAEPEKWSQELERCLKNTSHGEERTPASVINRALQVSEECIESAFAHFEDLEHLPTPEELKAKYAEIIKGKMGIGLDPAHKTVVKKDSGRLLDIWDNYVRMESIKQGWSERHLANIRTARMHIDKYRHKANLDDIDEEWVIGLVAYLANKRGLKNASIDKTLRLLKRFLRWAKKAELYTRDYQDMFDLRLKGADADRSDVYLTWEELSKVYTMPLHLHSERIARDLFCFLCFTGVRYGDLQRLQRKDIHASSIRFFAQKTDSYIDIPLNDYAKAILDRYKEEEYEGNRALPPMAEQRLNRTIKKVCEQAGINTPITRLRYSAHTRLEETYPKWELVSSHVGRHTFVVTALTLGIPSEVIRKYTGHKTEATMRPYIAIADQLKEQEMAKFNRPLHNGAADD